AFMVGAGRLRLEPKPRAIKLRSVRYRIAKRGNEYTPALDHQARQRSVHCVEPRLAAVGPQSTRNQHRATERPGCGKTALDIQKMKVDVPAPQNRVCLT